MRQQHTGAEGRSYYRHQRPTTRRLIFRTSVLCLHIIMTMVLGSGRPGAVGMMGFRRKIAPLRTLRCATSCSLKVPFRANETTSLSCQYTLHVRGGSLASSSSTRWFSSASVTHDSACRYRTFVAVGSNLGDRYGNIASALKMLCDSGWSFDDPSSTFVRIIRTSFLHETAPMYLTEQPAFLNGAVELETNLAPIDLLKRIKQIERELGRDFNTERNGPRPVDLDILLYDLIHEEDGCSPIVLETPDLVVPHPHIAERDFVLGPLCEIGAESINHPLLNATLGELFGRLKMNSPLNDTGKDGPVRVMPLPRGRMLHFNRTLIMGILNVTPDSFSDGGKLRGSVHLAVEAALQMEQDGADIIDIGGESTRPGAKETAIHEELERTIPVIQRIRQVSNVPISIDTRHAQVAREAVEAGADIVNDVSGGTFDPDMLRTISDLHVPVVLMHMRGTPQTMQAMTEYDNVVIEVARTLVCQSSRAEEFGIPRWMQILDPGIGFAKDLNGNLQLLSHMSELRSLIHNVPILLGTSRKGFIGKLSGEDKPENRDYGTIASCVVGLCLENRQADCNIVRVHNVKAMKQGIIIMDAIVGAKFSR